MIKIEKKIDSINEKLNINAYLGSMYEDIKNEECLFFDIETTGLNVKKTNLYLIGACFYKENSWYYVQYFAESLNDEKELLLEFNDLSERYKYIIHFNGNHFDIPYLEEKCIKHKLSPTFNKLISIDLYLNVKESKELLALNNCRQKTIEKFIMLNREDKFGGGELIPVYFEYLDTKSDEALCNLLLHNAEDLSGMLELLNVLIYIELYKNLESFNFQLLESDLTEENCKFKFKYSTDNNFKFVLTKFNTPSFIFDFDIKNSTMVLTTKNVTDTLKHFFKDYQNYYFVTDMNVAMHKSVAKFLDKDKRKICNKSNCCADTYGTFMPVLKDFKDITTFKIDYRSKQNYIQLYDRDKNKLINDEDLSMILINQFIKEKDII